MRFGTRRGIPLEVDYRGQQHVEAATEAGRGVLIRRPTWATGRHCSV